jgi:hypothetical protein
MFSKDDYIRYFNQISDIEKKMLENINELLKFINENSTIEILNTIKEDEIRHINILTKISKLVNDIKV